MEIIMAIIIDKSQGFVIMWRSIMDTAIWSNPKLLKVYQWCFFRANYKPLEKYKGFKKLNLTPGQFITSYPHAAGELNMSQGTVYNYINLLKAERIIERSSYNKYTVITILNWNDLQNPERFSENKLKTNYKQNETDNTLKELDKTEKKNINISCSLSYLLNIPRSDIQKFVEKFRLTEDVIRDEAEKAADWLRSKGKKYDDYQAFFRNWLRKTSGLQKPKYKPDDWHNMPLANP